jgi:pyruvate formate lyase activating enzyme
MISGIVFDIKRYAIHDGPGIRTTVFLKGCPLRCPWCHNPEGQNPDPETMVSVLRGKALYGAGETKIVGRVMEVEEVMVEIEKDLLFFDESGGGVTFSGGEPLAQPDFLTSLLEICKERNVHTCLDTCGYASSEVFCSVIDNVNLFLYDLKIMNDREHQKYTGVSNRLILENLKALDAQGKKVVIRFLVIPGITDTKENISETIDFIASLKTIRDVSLLPHHRIAGQKYKRLRRKNEMEDVPSATPKRMAAVGAEFERYGNRVTVGA